MENETISNQPLCNIAKLAEALAKAQSKITTPVKDRVVDFTDKNGRRVKYSYADLANVLDAVRIPLTENGLSVVHQLGYSRDCYGLTTILFHSSGESLKTWYPLPDPLKTQIRAQDFGSALTYARRYSLSSLIGIASEEDDDGASAADVKPPAKPSSPSSTPLIKPKTQASPQKGPEDEFQRFPDDDLDKYFDAPQTDSSDPASYVMPIGEVAGKKLIDIPEKTLVKILLWLEAELKKVPPAKNVGQLFEMNTKIKAFIKSMEL
jgi:uncharacterized protein (DUF3820 family)